MKQPSMKVNLYYRETFERMNLIKNFIYRLAFAICSYPRLIIEVILRVNFGERYFNFTSCITVAVLMFFMPLFMEGYNSELTTVLAEHWSWYLYIGVFLYFSNLRRLEIKRNPSTFDLATFSYSLGYNHYTVDKFFKSIFGQNLDKRIYDQYVEPLPFLVSGIALLLMHQILGVLLILCAICYSVSYSAAYYFSDNAILDIIDKWIYNKNLSNMIVGNKPPSETQGAYFLSRKPKNDADRENLVKMIFAEDEGVDVN
jgi:hypothetical protein